MTEVPKELTPAEAQVVREAVEKTAVAVAPATPASASATDATTKSIDVQVKENSFSISSTTSDGKTGGLFKNQVVKPSVPKA